MKKISTKKIIVSGIFVALAVAGSLFSVPVAGSKCAPVQHMVNVMSAVFLGPWYGIVIAFLASLIRNLMGIGSFMAFPGSMVGALFCGIAYHVTKKLSITCIAEAVGTGFFGGILAYPVAKFLMGISPESMFVFVIPFLISTVVGSVIAFIVLKSMEKMGAFRLLNNE